LSCVGQPFLRALVLPLFVILLVVAMLDATVDWGQVRQQIAAQPPWLAATSLTGLMLAWSIVAGRALTTVWQARVMRFLVRQPLTRVQWVLYLAPSLALAFVPVAAIWWLGPRLVSPFVHYVAFTGLAWPIIFGASGTRPIAWGLAGMGALALALLMFGYLHAPAIAYLAIVVTLAELPLGVTLIRGEISPPSARISAHLSDRHAVVVVVRRDLRGLVRNDAKRLLGALGVALVAALLMLAFRSNGEVAGRAAFDIACVLVTVAASPIYELLEAIKRRLGREIMRRRWPITVPQRARALVALSGGLVGPGVLLIAAPGSTMGVGYLLLFALAACAIALLAAGFFAIRLVAQRSDIGWFYLILLCHTLLVMFLPVAVYVPLAVAIIGSSALLVTRGLRAFLEQMEGAQ
jgi:hypothetical protein